MIPQKFGRYEVLGELGDGAMGRVYRAFDPVVRRTVAIKTIKSEFLSKEEAPEYLRRFRREAQAAGVLNHPSIVSIFDVGDDYLVMEFLEGKTLQQVLQAKGKLEPLEAIRVLAPVGEGLDHAHRSGIVHRDIKPANIMVLPDGRAKLMDFGVAHVETSVMTTAGQIFGSPSYMSPEQVSGAEVTSQSDLYSLAIVAYEALTGQRPFQGASLTSIIYKVMSEVPAPPRQLNAALPARYDDVFERALAKDINRRYTTAADFVAALDLKEFDLAISSVAGDAPALAETARKGPVPPGTSTLAPGTGTVASTGTVSGTISGNIAPAAPPAPPGLARGGPAKTGPGPKSNGLWLGLAGVAVVALIAFFVWRRPAEAPVADASPATASPSPESPTPAPASSVAPAGSPATTPSAAVSSPEATSPPTAAPTASPRAVRVAATPSVKATPTPTPPPVLVEGTLVDLEPTDTPPRRVSGESAPYPEQARRLKQFGTVAVGMIINAQGEPTDLKIIESAGQILDAAVLKAVGAWRFEPAQRDGVKVSVHFVARQRFQQGP